jgi:hypothetical protein
MDQFKTQENLTFQFISFYDRTIFHFVERVTQHLRESIYVILEESIKDSQESLTLGDIIPDKYISTKSNWYIYQMDQYQDVEDIIQQLNQDLYGTNLIEMSDPEIDVVVKFVHGFNSKN